MSKSSKKIAQFPSTRYQGSKAKLLPWLRKQLTQLHFDSALDLFGGTGSVSYLMKTMGKAVTYNDYLRCNSLFAKALLENTCVTISSSELESILNASQKPPEKRFIQETFEDIYFTNEENLWLDQILQQIRKQTNQGDQIDIEADQSNDFYRYAILFFALAQACIVKRPYNLFHRKNLYLRMAQVERSFGNKSSWDKPFPLWFQQFVEEANQAVFQGKQPCSVLQRDALDISGEYDLVYMDPPYISQKGNAVNYRDFYHFLEGISFYDQWPKHIDHRSKHLRLQRQSSPWSNKNQIHQAFRDTFKNFQESTIVLSYRSDGIPDVPTITSYLKEFKKKVRVKEYGSYQYALSKNQSSKEILWIAEDK